MWLLNATTRKLEQYYGEDIPPYAILSHRWEKEEVMFDDLENDPARLKGYHKIDMCCRLAQSQGAISDPIVPLEYVWIDTCCINKRDSAELSEAINSMYKWYQKAEICYAFLYDVEDVSQISESEWFTRGWTLQELLAPAKLVFLSKAWTQMNFRNCSYGESDRCLDSECLSKSICRSTKIPFRALQGFHPEDYSVAERFSWASSRKTTREEDRAYSLLGIFRVNMPMLYGEGASAFQRLQEEIMKASNDLTIFLWSGDSCPYFGMLAQSPGCFSKHIEQLNQNGPDRRFRSRGLFLTQGFTIDNAGISLELLLETYSPFMYVAYLADPPTKFSGQTKKAEDRHTSSHPLIPPRIANESLSGRAWYEVNDGTLLGIFLQRSGHQNLFHRVSADGRSWCEEPIGDLLERRSARVAQIRISRRRKEMLIGTKTGFQFDRLPAQKFIYERSQSGMQFPPAFHRPREMEHAESPHEFHRSLVNPLHHYGLFCMVHVKIKKEELRVYLGYTFDASPLCLILYDPDSQKSAMDHISNLKLLQILEETEQRRRESPGYFNELGLTGLKMYSSAFVGTAGFEKWGKEFGDIGLYVEWTPTGNTYLVKFLPMLGPKRYRHLIKLLTS